MLYEINIVCLGQAEYFENFVFENGLSNYFIYQLEPFALFPQTRNATLLPLFLYNLSRTSHNCLFLLMD